MTEASTRNIETAPGITLSVTVAGEGPLVILTHGFPELGMSWRHQVKALSEAGYMVAAPDMRGYGLSSAPQEISAYTMDQIVDDMAAVARALGKDSWVAVGHDFGASVAWRSALRFPEAVRGVFCLSIPYSRSNPEAAAEMLNHVYADRFFYVRYFQEVGPPEAELEADPRAALKQIFFVASGDAPKDAWIAYRPIDNPLLADLPEPPEGPLSFMSDEELDTYADRYARTGFFSSISWYRNIAANSRETAAYGDQRIRQPAGFLAGDKEVVLSMTPGALERQADYLDDLRSVTIIPGAGHWIQQERPAEVNAALIAFLDDIRDRL